MTTRAPWRCDRPGTFAWATCVERWPRLVRETAQHLGQLHANSWAPPRSLNSPPPDGVDAVAGAQCALEALAVEIVDGPLVALDSADREGGRWDGVVEVGAPWTAQAWYAAEAYLYARIAGIARRWLAPTFGDDVDVFAPQKRLEEATIVDGPRPATLEDALWKSLWGNRADLSLPSARDHHEAAEHLLLVDDRPDALVLLASARKVALLADNAAVELWHDLRLAELLVSRGVAVTLWVKDRPFFVSDATPADVARLAPAGLPGVDVVAEPSLTGPGFLTRAALPVPFVDALAEADVIIAKGDCTYRRLVGDVPWRADDTRTFGNVVDLPAPVISLRTLKAEVLVGAPTARCLAAAEADPQWLVSGRLGVVQVAR